MNDDYAKDLSDYRLNKAKELAEECWGSCLTPTYGYGADRIGQPETQRGHIVF
jgi:hypothetical protein